MDLLTFSPKCQTANALPTSARAARPYITPTFFFKPFIHKLPPRTFRCANYATKGLNFYFLSLFPSPIERHAADSQDFAGFGDGDFAFIHELDVAAQFLRIDGLSRASFVFAFLLGQRDPRRLPSEHLFAFVLGDVGEHAEKRIHDGFS